LLGFTRVANALDLIKYIDTSKFEEDGKTPNHNYGKTYAIANKQYSQKLNDALRTFAADMR